MARFVDVAAVHFNFPHPDEKHSMAECVVRDLRKSLDMMDGTGLDFIVICEGVESRAQTIETAETIESPGIILGMYRDFAVKNNSVIAGSVKLLQDGEVYNATVLALPDGKLEPLYFKNYLTVREGKGGIGVTPGNGVKVIDTPAGRIGAAICFDLNYTGLIDQYRKLKPDIIAFSSMFHGGLMQGMWAYGTRSFFLGACKDIASTVVDPLGRTVQDCIPYSVSQIYARSRINLDRFTMHLDFNGKKFDEVRKKYGKDVFFDVEHGVATAILYSLSDIKSAEEIAAEFELESLDDYLARSARNCGKDW